MKRILILTKHILGEQELQNILQHLHYEVFLLTYQEQSEFALHDFVTYFDLIILSGTLTNQEAKGLKGQLSLRSVDLLDLAAQSANQREFAINRLTGNSYQQAIGGITSTVALQPYQSEPKLAALNWTAREAENQPTAEQPQYFYLSLSQLEKALITELAQYENQVLSRQHLCQAIWHEDCTNSHLSQLSTLVKNIKRKVARTGFDRESILTIWGKGYKLTKECYQYLCVHQEDVVFSCAAQ